MTASPSDTQASSAQPRTETSGLKKAFESVPGSDYARDILALILLGASLKLPLAGVGGQTLIANTQALYVLMVALAGLALTLPYLTRFGIMPKGWTVGATRTVRIILAVPFIGYFLWLLVGPHLVDLSHQGVGTAFAVGGAGVALAAQARQSELGPADQDRSATSTAALSVIVLTAAIAIAYVASLVVVLVKANESTNFPYIGVVFAIVSAAAFILIPAFAVALKRTAGWASFVIGLGITLTVIFYFGAENAGALPLLESFVPGDSVNLGAALFLPLTFILGVGSFMLPALAATVASPAFKRVTVRNSPLEERLDLAAVTLRMSALVGLILILVSAVYLITYGDAAGYLGAERATGQVITVMVLGLIVVLVSFAALKSFNANPAGARIGIAISLVVTSLSGLIIMTSAPLLGEKVLVAGHLILFLGLPLIGAYAIIGNKETRQFFANFAAQRPEPSTASYEWTAPTAQQAPAAGYGQPHTGLGHVPQTGQVNMQQTGQTHVAAQQPYQGQQQPAQNSGFAPATGQQPAAQQPVAHPTFQERQQPVQEPQEPDVQQRVQETQQASQEPQQPTQQSAPQTAQQPQASAPGLSSDAVNPHGDDIATQTVSRQAVADLMKNQDARQEAATQVAPQSPAAASHGYTREVALDPLTPAVVLAKIAEVAPELRPALAQNPSTYDALLGWLSQIGDPEVDAALKRRNS